MFVASVSKTNSSFSQPSIAFMVSSSVHTLESVPVTGLYPRWSPFSFISSIFEETILAIVGVDICVVAKTSVIISSAWTEMQPSVFVFIT